MNTARLEVKLQSSRFNELVDSHYSPPMDDSHSRHQYTNRPNCKLYSISYICLDATFCLYSASIWLPPSVSALSMFGLYSIASASLPRRDLAANLPMTLFCLAQADLLMEFCAMDVFDLSEKTLLSGTASLPRPLSIFRTTVVRSLTMEVGMICLLAWLEA